MIVNLDPVGDAVVWRIRNNGYNVEITQDGETQRATTAVMPCCPNPWRSLRPRRLGGSAVAQAHPIGRVGPQGAPTSPNRVSGWRNAAAGASIAEIVATPASRGVR